MALRALLACPTGSIESLGNDDLKPVMQDFPIAIEEPVHYWGYNSLKSYGGNSYFIRHSAGNWLIDSPKFTTPIVKQLEALGGVDHIFLTHRDDVAKPTAMPHTSKAVASFIGMNSGRNPVRKSFSKAMVRGSWHLTSLGFRRPAIRSGGPICLARFKHSCPARMVEQKDAEALPEFLPIHHEHVN